MTGFLKITPVRLGGGRSIPAALGWVIIRAGRDLPGLREILRLGCAIDCSTI